MDNHDVPINVIVLDDVERVNENLVSVYYDIIKTCKKSSEVKAALKMMCDEQYELTLRAILIKDIQNKATILQETKKY